LMLFAGKRLLGFIKLLDAKIQHGLQFKLEFLQGISLIFLPASIFAERPTPRQEKHRCQNGWQPYLSGVYDHLYLVIPWVWVFAGSFSSIGLNKRLLS